MTPPYTSKFEATADVWTFAFDGVTWTGTGPGFEDGILPRLTRRTPYHQRTHYTVDRVATLVLNDTFPEGWTKTASYRGELNEAPPPGMKS
jgi:hypothetical protein